MAFALADRVQETTTTTGTGTITLAGASTQFQSFAAGIGSGNTTYYTITSGDGTNWEVGEGTLAGTGPYTLSRSTVFSSSNGNALISLSGTSTVFCDLPASKIGSVSTPSQVQVATAATTSQSQSSLTVTMSAATTVGNTLLLVAAGFDAPITPPAGAVNILTDRGITLSNEQISSWALPITTSATTYTITISGPNGNTNLLGAEISGAKNFVAANQLCNISANTAEIGLFSAPNGLYYMCIQVDSSSALSSYSAGLTEIAYLNGSGNHGTFFGSFDASERGTIQSVTFASVPTGTIGGVVAAFN